MKTNLPYLRPDRDRYGVMRYYVRRHGRKIRIREKPGTDAFLRATRPERPLMTRDDQRRSGGHAWLAGRTLFRVRRIRPDRSEIAAHSAQRHRRLPERAAETRQCRSDARLPAVRSIVCACEDVPRP
jgi:hypothetical protein